MNTLNEKVGYINKEQFNLKYVIEYMTNVMCNPEGIPWQNYYEVNGKTNKKDIDGFTYYTFKFTLNNQTLGDITIILVNIDKKIKKLKSYKFSNFITGQDSAFYSVVDSTVDKKKNNHGYIYVSYNEFEQYIKDKKTLQKEITPYIYHELRHYYDNIMGVFTGKLKELSHITLYADSFNINTKVFLDNVKKEKPNYHALKTLLYMSQPTELNAWYHSFVINITDVVKSGKATSAKEVVDYIKTDTNKKHCENFIFNYETFYKTIDNYKEAILSLCKDDPIKMVYYINNTLTACNASDETIENLNKLFEKKYSNYFVTSLDYKQFTNILTEFLETDYIKYVYKKISPVFLHTVNNMKKFIATLF